MTGKFKTFEANTLTLGHPPGPDSLHAVAPNATVTLDGKTSKMGDLKADDNVEVSGDPATSVTASRLAGGLSPSATPPATGDQNRGQRGEHGDRAQ